MQYVLNNVLKLLMSKSIILLQILKPQVFGKLRQYQMDISLNLILSP